MLKFKLGAVLGFAAGWAVGTGRAAALWDQIQRAAGQRAEGTAPAGSSTTTFGQRADGPAKADDRSIVA
jgi:hypothetical protein